MAEQSVIVWDLETVPDLAAAARILDLPNATDAEVREALGTTFPKHPLHKIVCIGALIASRQPEGWRVDALGAPHIGERSEAKLISDFIEKIGGLRPQLSLAKDNRSAIERVLLVPLAVISLIATFLSPLAECP
jgi:3'-5' exonuclease